MDLNSSLDHYLKTRDFGPLNEALFIKVQNYVKTSHYQLVKIDKYSDYQRETFFEPKVVERLSRDVLDELLLTISAGKDFYLAFQRMKIERKIENFDSYIFTTLHNMHKTDRYTEMNGRYKTFFDNAPEDYHFWLGYQRKRSVDSTSKHSHRKYYLSRWDEIPDLIERKLENYMLRKVKNPEYVLTGELKDIVDEAFDRTERSIKIRHFLNYLIYIGVIDSIPNTETIETDDESDGPADTTDIQPDLSQDDLCMFESVYESLRPEVRVTIRAYVACYFENDNPKKHAACAAERTGQTVQNVYNHLRKGESSLGSVFLNKYNEFNGDAEGFEKSFHDFFLWVFENHTESGSFTDVSN